MTKHDELWDRYFDVLPVKPKTNWAMVAVATLALLVGLAIAGLAFYLMYAT